MGTFFLNCTRTNSWAESVLISPLTSMTPRNIFLKLGLNKVGNTNTPHFTTNVNDLCQHFSKVMPKQSERWRHTSLFQWFSGNKCKQRFSVWAVKTMRPAQISCNNSRTRAGIAMRPLASKLMAWLPKNWLTFLLAALNWFSGCLLASS